MHAVRAKEDNLLLGLVVKELLNILEWPKHGDAHGKTPVKNLGFLSCANKVDIKHVPFYGPCIITVLSGKKTIFDPRGTITCEAGCTVTVPAPASFDLRNEPDHQSKRYKALVIPFAHKALDDLSKVHGINHDRHDNDVRVLKFEYDATLAEALKHYLTCGDNGALMNHRLMEILLILVSKNASLLSYTLAQDVWSQRVRAILATDLTRDWDIAEVCKRLATTESTLRRNLNKENVGFREMLSELRMTTALMQLLQTNHPVYRVAYDCGYQSVSRFSANFHKRFGLPPRDFRESLNELEHGLPVSG